MRSRSVVLCLIIVGATFTTVVRGEVAAVVDRSGNYRYMTYKYVVVGGETRIWNANDSSSQRRALNPRGDAFGDLAPSVVDSPELSIGPMVVWPHPNGGDYDLVYSTWSGSGWSPIRSVAADNPYDDFEPRLAPNSRGQVYMVWWRDEAGVGAVYFSAYMGGRWTSPFRVSTVGIDARHASLVVLGDTLVDVAYDTPAGADRRELTINSTDSITDDIDPKLQIIR